MLQLDSLSVDEDDHRGHEMELKVIGKIPRPAVALERNQQSSLLSFMYQLCSASVHLPGPGGGTQQAGGRNFHGNRKDFELQTFHIPHLS